MGYSKEIYQQAQQVLAQRRQDAETAARLLHARMVAKYPQLPELERQLAASSLGVARVILEGRDVQARIAALRDENLHLQNQIAQLLEKEGETVRNFDPQYTCPHCQDTGVKATKNCSCLLQLMQQMACEQICLAGKMKMTDFDDVKLDYYPDTPDESGVSTRQRMQHVLQYCRTYAEEFDGKAPNLMLRGATGTGKTFLSLAIAKRVTERGYSAIYAPIQQLLSRLEREHFGKSDGDSMQIMTECDLLVIDDLGTEFTTPFYIACLYQLVNTRMMEGKPTIISTNLKPEDILTRYGEQLTSRLAGTFIPLLFFGKDIRLLTLSEQW